MIFPPPAPLRCVRSIEKASPGAHPGPVMVSGDARAAMPRGVVRSRAAPSPPDPGPQLPRPVRVRSAGLGFIPPYKAKMQPQTVPHGGAESFLLRAPRAALPVPPYTPPHYTHFARAIQNPTVRSRTVLEFSSHWALKCGLWGRVPGWCGPGSAPIPESPGQIREGT